MQLTMQGRVCLVTGATSGIGKAAATALAGMGATVVLVARSREKGEATRAEIAARTGSTTLELLLADLSVQAQVRTLAADFRARHDRLHVLLNNAGAAFPRRRVSADGIEMTLALNHLSYFLLTNLLLDLLRAGAPARIVNVSSDGHRAPGFDLSDLQFERRRYRPLTAYGHSKLANIAFTRELARRLAGSGVTVNALHPGTVATNIAGAGTFIAWLWRHLPGIRTPEQGADTAVWLATAPELAGATGGYYIDRKRVEPSARARSDDLAGRLWDLSEQMTGLSPGGAAPGR